MSDEDEREFMRRLFSAEQVPADVVPGSGMTRQDYLDQNDAAGTWAEVTRPGEVVVDVDGIPSAMSPPETWTVYRAPTVVTVAELAAVGLTPEDVPKLRVLPTPQPKEKHT